MISGHIVETMNNTETLKKKVIAHLVKAGFNQSEAASKVEENLKFALYLKTPAKIADFIATVD